MPDVCVCTVVYGHRNYFRAGRQAVRSVLARSDFDVFVAYGPGPEYQLPDSPRVRAPASSRRFPATAQCPSCSSFMRSSHVFA
jgi:hypothetical protein